MGAFAACGLTAVGVVGLAFADGEGQAWPRVGPDGLLQPGWPLNASVPWRDCPGGEPADVRPDTPLIVVTESYPGEPAPWPDRIGVQFVLYRDGRLIRMDLDMRPDGKQPIRFRQRRYQLAPPEIHELVKAVAPRRLVAGTYWTPAGEWLVENTSCQGPGDTELHVWVDGCKRTLVIPALSAMELAFRWPATGKASSPPARRPIEIPAYVRGVLREEVRQELEPMRHFTRPGAVFAELPGQLREALDRIMSFRPKGGVTLCTGMRCWGKKYREAPLPGQDSWLRARVQIRRAASRSPQDVNLPSSLGATSVPDIKSVIAAWRERRVERLREWRTAPEVAPSLRLYSAYLLATVEPKERAAFLEEYRRAWNGPDEVDWTWFIGPTQEEASAFAEACGAEKLCKPGAETAYLLQLAATGDRAAIRTWIDTWLTHSDGHLTEMACVDMGEILGGRRFAACLAEVARAGERAESRLLDCVDDHTPASPWVAKLRNARMSHRRAARLRDRIINRIENPSPDWP